MARAQMILKNIPMRPEERGAIIMRIVELRDEYENTKTLENFLKYKKYMEIILTKVRMMRLKQRPDPKSNLSSLLDTFFASTVSIELSLASDFELHFRRAVASELGFDKTLLEKYLEFCTKWHVAGVTLNHIATAFSTRPEVWLLAASSCVKEKNERDARSFLLRGIRCIPNNIELHTALIDLEIDLVKEVRSTGRGRDGKLTSLNVAFESAVDELVPLPVEFLLHVGTKLRQLKCAMELNLRVLELTMETFPHSVAYYDARARIDFEESMLMPSAAMDNIGQTLHNAFILYQEGLRLCSGPELRKMYVSFMKDLRERNLPLDAEWDDYFKRPNITKDDLLLYAEMEGDLDLTVIEHATKKFPTEVTFCCRLMECYIDKGEIAKGQELFGRLLQTPVGEEEEEKISRILGVCARIIDYETSKLRTTGLDYMCQLVCREENIIGKRLRAMYLEWVVQMQGIEAGRAVMRKSYMVKGLHESVYKKMLELERKEPQISVYDMRYCFYRIASMSSQNPQDWIDWCDFEYEHGDKYQIMNIYDGAISTLHPDCIEEFTSIWGPTAVVKALSPTLTSFN